MIVVETTVWVDLFRERWTPQTAWLRRNIVNPEIALTDLTFCEVLQGIRADAVFARTREQLLIVGVLPTGETDIALKAAEHYRFLRKRGITVRSTIDCLIATYCLREGHWLLHNDRDFEPFEQHFGLRVIHP